MKKYFENLLQKNMIPFMEIIHIADYINIKVYFPKIITSLCKLLIKKFIIKNKDTLIIKRDEDGYHKVDLEIKSMLKQIWGISEF